MKLSKNSQRLIIITAVLILGIVAVVFLRSGDNQITKQKDNSEVALLNSIEFQERTRDPNAFIIDVHTPEQTHIPGTDVFIPYDDISNNLDKLPEDKSTPLLVYCRSGSMSKIATKELVALGYTNVSDLSGGINSYKQSVKTVEITPANIDLGTVIYGDVATTSFTLTNFTPEPLNITRVSTSCTCTTAEVVKKSLAPYESTQIKVAFDPAVHKDDTDLGELIRTIYIDTDNELFPQVTSSIQANVIKN